MMLKIRAIKKTLFFGGLTLAAVLVAQASPAQARVFVGFGFGAPFFAPPLFYGPPVVYAPPPVVYAPPPMAYAPPVVYVQPAQPAPQYWYYCHNPQGYYPTVQACGGGWQAVLASPSPGR